MIESDNDRVRKARVQYQAKQDREKRIQEMRVKLEKPEMLMKLCIVLGVGLVSGIWSIYKIFT